MTPSNGADHALIDLLLVQHPQLRLLRRDIRLRDLDRSVPALKAQPIGIALLRRDPAFLHQRLIAVPGDLGEIAVGLCLLQRGAHLGECGFGLCDLMVKLGRRYFDQQLTGLDAAADVDFAL